ncbi:MAG TPA: transposase, partial [Candidatus Cloacimonadota bacterium]|nr:transposase [Candidatus Cloacimonadota bacterium]
MASSTSTYLLYHAIFSTKKRERILQKHVRSDLYAFMGGIIKEIGGMPVLINGTEDHVHILAFLPKHVCISD